MGRHSVLSLFNTLRWYRGAYFTWYLRLHHLADGHLQWRSWREHYSIAPMQDDGTVQWDSPSLDGGDRSVLDGWLRLDLDTTDFIAAPHGVMGWLQVREGRPTPVVHDPVDYFCQPTLITHFCEFMHLLAWASGLARSSSNGYTFVTLGEWYNSHLERAHRCPNIAAVREWLERSVRGFKSALSAIKGRLRAILYSRALERPFDTFVLSFDDECLSELRAAEMAQDRLAELEQYHGSASSAPALQSTALPLLSSLIRPPAEHQNPLAELEQYHGPASSAPALRNTALPPLSSLIRPLAEPPARLKGNLPPSLARTPAELNSLATKKPRLSEAAPSTPAATGPLSGSDPHEHLFAHIPEMDPHKEREMRQHMQNARRRNEASAAAARDSSSSAFVHLQPAGAPIVSDVEVITAISRATGKTVKETVAALESERRLGFSVYRLDEDDLHAVAAVRDLIALHKQAAESAPARFGPAALGTGQSRGRPADWKESAERVLEVIQEVRSAHAARLVVATSGTA